MFGIVELFFALFGDGKNGFLNAIGGFIGAETCLDGNGVDEFPVRLIELVPSSLVLPVIEFGNQAFPRFSANGGEFQIFVGFFFLVAHGVKYSNNAAFVLLFINGDANE